MKGIEFVFLSIGGVSRP